MTAQIGELRSLAHGKPSAERWAQLLAELEAWPQGPELTRAIEYLDEVLERWPAALRQAPQRWQRAALEGEPPIAWPLLRRLQWGGLRLKPSELMPLFELLEDHPMESLVLDGSRFSREGFAKLASLELRGLKSLQFRASLGSHATDLPFAPLLSAPWRSGLERLDISWLRGPIEVDAELGFESLEHLACDGAALYPGRGMANLLLRPEALPKLRSLRFASMGADQDTRRQLMERLALSPIERLELRGLLMRQGPSYLSRLRRELVQHLGLGQCRMELEELEAIFGGCRFEALETLDLNDTLLDDRQMAVLAKAELPALKALHLWNHRLTLDGYEELSAAEWSSGLQRLDLRGGPIEVEGLDALHDGMSSLRRLCLESYATVDAVVERLATKEGFAGLHELEIQVWGVRQEAASVFGRGLSKLRYLQVPLEDNEPELIALMLQGKPRLVRLDLPGRTPMPSGGLAAILDSLQAELESLDLSGNMLNDEDVKLLASHPICQSLRRLRLQGCGVSAQGVEVLQAAPFWGQLQSLSLSGNPLGDGGVMALAVDPSLQDLSLQLSMIPMGQAGLRALLASETLPLSVVREYQRRD